ncbi:MAG: nucleoside triphosphate pyrophosphohydrolase [Myxococcaceae bacterium]
MADTGEALTRLVGIMARLRAEGGCPWDREQDLRSLRPYLMEESFEVLDEMDRVSSGGPWRPLCEELGDLLFQIVFHAQLASELNEFTMADVCNAISDKITSRHPHVFGDQKVSGATQVLENWAKLKAAERKKKTGSEGSVLDGVPSKAPSLMRAERLTEKASRIGFDWPSLEGVKEKLREELAELDEAILCGDRDALEHELGDVLFSLANLARFIKTPPEDALRAANRRFTERFSEIETGLREQKIPFGQASLEQMDALWVKAKAKEKALPKPRSLSRSSLVEVSLPSRDVAATTRFWDAVAPLLGWTRLRAETAYSDGLMTYRFVDAASSGGPVRSTAPALRFEAPSARAVDAFADALAHATSSHRIAAVREGDGPYLIAFEDPSGIRCRYGFGG